MKKTKQNKTNKLITASALAVRNNNINRRNSETLRGTHTQARARTNT